MALESPVTYISDLVASNPTVSDPRNEGDDHIRNVKSAIKATFPNVTGAVTPTHTELNYVDGVTSAIQTQLDAKAGLASPTFTGTLTAAALTATGNVTLGDASTDAVTVAGNILLSTTNTESATREISGWTPDGLGRASITFENSTSGAGSDSTINFYTNKFGVSRAIRMAIAPEGSVTINAPSSGFGLTVTGQARLTQALIVGDNSAENGFHVTNDGGATGGRFYTGAFGAGTLRMSINNAGNVTINAPTGGAALSVSGVSTSAALALTAAANGANVFTVTRDTLTYAVNVDATSALIHNVASSHPQQFRTNNALRLDLTASGAINFGTTGTQWQVDTSNRLLNPGNTQPSFHARAAAAKTTTGTFGSYTAQDHNQGSMLNTTSGVVTVPVDGRYMVCFSGGATVSSGTGYAFVIAYKNGSPGNWNGVPVNIPNNAYSQGFSQSMIVSLAANDTVEIVLSTVSGTSAEVSVTQFSMHLLG